MIVVLMIFVIYQSFEDSRIFVRNLNLKSKTEWVEYCKFDKLPDYIPNRPDHVYKYNGWINWGDWLGFYYRQYLSIEEFKKFIKDTFPNIPPGIELRKAYESWWDENKPDYLPKNVADYYNK